MQMLSFLVQRSCGPITLVIRLRGGNENSVTIQYRSHSVTTEWHYSEIRLDIPIPVFLKSVWCRSLLGKLNVAVKRYISYSARYCSNSLLKIILQFSLITMKRDKYIMLRCMGHTENMRGHLSFSIATATPGLCLYNACIIIIFIY